MTDDLTPPHWNELPEQVAPADATAALAEAEARGYARAVDDAAGVARRLGGKSMRFCEDAIRALAKKEAGE